jgi:hypothetical protein
VSVRNKSICKSNGQVFIVEPPFHVSTAEFEETVGKAGEVGFTDVEGPDALLGKTVILKKG